MRIKKYFVVLLVTCTLLMSGMTSVVFANSDITSIKIVHTNDIHGRNVYDAKNNVFGFDKLATFVKQQQADLIVDAGDLFHGQAFATLEEGASIAQLVNAVGYDVIVPGNHDWNYGKEQLKTLGTRAGATLLAGNISEDGASFFENDGTYTKIVDGVKIGVLGVFDQDVKDSTAPSNIEGLLFTNDVQKANELAQRLRNEGCDIVIAISHQLDCDAFISETQGIDVLIAGHEHSEVSKKIFDKNHNAVTIVETGSYFQNVGSLSISYDTKNNEIVSIDETLVTAKDAANITSDSNLSQIFADINTRQQSKLSTVVGSTGVVLDGRWEQLRIKETTLGRLVCASYLKETDADIAFENAGGIRLGREIPFGNITYRDVIDISPFANYIVTKQIRGDAVKSIIEKSIDIGLQNQRAYDAWIRTNDVNTPWPNENGNYLQFSGIQVQYDAQKQLGERVVSMRIKGQDVQPNEFYKVATNNYIALGKTYSELKNVAELNQYGACDEAIIRFIQQGQSIVDKSATTVGIQTVEITEKSSKISPNTASRNVSISSLGFLLLCVLFLGVRNVIRHNRI